MVMRLAARRRLWWTLSVLLGAAVAAMTLRPDPSLPPDPAGTDLRVYLDATRAWLAGGAFYHAHQLTGPYNIVGGDILYPPVAILLFAPFLVVPVALWWIVPIGGTAIIARHAHPLRILVALLLLALPVSRATLWYGNPVIWVAFATAAGFRFGWPGPFALLKPSLFVFALAGIRKRSWWGGLVAFVALCIPFGAMWIDWLRTLVNSNGSLAYSLPQVPLLLAVVAVSWRQSETIRESESETGVLPLTVYDPPVSAQSL